MYFALRHLDLRALGWNGNGRGLWIAYILGGEIGGSMELDLWGFCVLGNAWFRKYVVWFSDL